MDLDTTPGPAEVIAGACPFHSAMCDKARPNVMKHGPPSDETFESMPGLASELDMSLSQRDLGKAMDVGPRESLGIPKRVSRVAPTRLTMDADLRLGYM